ncbi:S8 family peptidase [Paenibacillus albicereus]|uniref:S8 family peptidase n=1 Tax=Paenibacillus albicereus TaxID=2726185 RepID=A0A6H2GWM6_9BACL|nr:S8 family peptidase [Paenibacillus albicereus]QJC51807.1 S8 family peptidase [Paenibacillus albicereus]
MKKNSIGSCLRACACSRPGRHATRRIVVLKSRKAYDEAVRELARGGIRPLRTWKSSRILCLRLDRRVSWQELLRHPELRSLEKDAVVRALGASVRDGRTRRSGKRRRSRPCGKLPWNIRRVEAPPVWRRTLGSGIRLAVIDTGVGPHPDLRVAGGVNVSGGRSYRDDNGHGTHVAGIAAGRGSGGGPLGVAPGASLYAVKALDADGFGSLTSILDAIEWCIDNRMDVVNMSLGLPPGTRSAALRRVVRRARRAGLVLVAAAGNAGVYSGGLDVPASYPETIAVAASNRRGRIASFSSRGKGIDLTAPGDEICSCWLDGGYETDSGTSMSAPHVAGGAALLLSANPGLPAAAVSPVLRRWAKPVPGASKRAQGSGLLQLRRIGSVFYPGVRPMPGRHQAKFR